MIISIFCPNTETTLKAISVSGRPVYTPESLSIWAKENFAEIGELHIIEELRPIPEMPEGVLSRLPCQFGLTDGA